jgi:hypothetical protein
MDLLTKYLNLDINDEHPLPWYPPFCSTYAKNIRVPIIDDLAGIIFASTKGRNPIYAESQLRPVLLNLVSPNLRSAVSEADIGQRINTLLKYVRLSYR